MTRLVDFDFSKRTIVNFGIKDSCNTGNDYPCLNFNKEGIIFSCPTGKEEIPYNDIINVTVSLNREVGKKLRGIYDNEGHVANYYLDLDILSFTKKYKFESTSLENVYNILVLLAKNDISINDDMGLYPIFRECKTTEEIYLEFENHYKQWKIDFDL